MSLHYPECKFDPLYCSVPVYRFHTGSFRSLKHPDGQHILIGRNIYRPPCDGTLMQDTFLCMSTCVPEDILVWGPSVRGWKHVLNATDLLIKPALWMFLKLLLCHADSFSSLFLQQNRTIKGGLHFGEYLIWKNMMKHVDSLKIQHQQK